MTPPNNKHHRLYELFDEIDAAVFSGDEFLSLSLRLDFLKLLARWDEAVSELGPKLFPASVKDEDGRLYAVEVYVYENRAHTAGGEGFCFDGSRWAGARNPRKTLLIPPP